MGEEGEKGSAFESLEALYREARQLIEKLANTGELEATVRFLAWLNTRVLEPRGARLIVVGGLAAEIYSGRSYRTLDADVIVEADPQTLDLLRRLLEMLGERPSREYLVPGIPKAIDIVATVAKDIVLVELETPEGKLYIESPEDAITACLRGWKYWQSTEDRDKALAILMAWKDKLDYNYLRQKAQKDTTLDHLERLLKLIDSYNEQT